MKRYEVLKAVVILQAVCMIALSVVVVVKVWPDDKPRPSSNEGATNVSGGPGDTGQPSDEWNEDRIAAVVGPDQITADDLAARLQLLYGDAVLRTMMIHKAIELETADSDLEVSGLELQRELEQAMEGYASEEQFFEFMSKQLGLSKELVMEDFRYKLLLEKIAIRTIEVSEAEVSAYIEEHPKQYAPRLQLHLRWIVTDSRALADEVISLLETGEAFTTLASAYSIDEHTAHSGGDIGYIDSDDPFYEQELLETASHLQVAEMAGPIPVEGGFAIIQLMERKLTSTLSGRRLSEAVRKQLALDRAKPLAEIEEELLVKYAATVK